MASQAEIKGKLLVIDDDPRIRHLLVNLLKPMGYAVDEAASAEEALAMISAGTPDLVILDLHMPGKSGHDVLEEIRSDSKTRLLPVVMLTGGATRQDKLKAIEAGVTDFIAKPFDPVELAARVRSLVQLKFFTDELEHAEQVIITLAKAIDARDPYTLHHSERVSFYAGLLGERIGLKGPELEAVRRGGLFHDIGKIAIRDGVLLKPGKLTPEEYEEIKRHPVVGRDLIQHMKTLAYALPIVYHHHERLDGSGYPEGLSGEAIPLVARVTTIADIYDALTRWEALEIMAREAAKGYWDARILDEFRGVLETVPEGNTNNILEGEG